MKNSFGTNVSVTLFGESHGPAVGAVIDGLAPGIRVDEDLIRFQLDLRRSLPEISTKRREGDKFVVESGVFKGFTTGTPICILIPNEDVSSGDYERLRAVARPGHGDYTARCKYYGFEDYRGGGHFSGRLTAALTAAGAVCISALRERGILMATHLKECGGIADADFADCCHTEDLKRQCAELNQRAFGVLDVEAGERMKAEIKAAAAEKDSVGGVLETLILGLPAGLGEPFWDSVESLLAHGLFSIPAVKGVEFGAGFAAARLRGSAMNDSFFVKEGRIATTSNNNGGINGGLTNGMPVVVRCAVKPTPSIFSEQNTVDFETMEERKLELSGRHDPCIVHRARVVTDSVVAIALCDLLAQRYGTDWIGGRNFG